MIVLLFILYYPMRILLSPLPGIPIPTFGNFVKYPEIVELWSKWALWVVVWSMMTYIVSFFTSWYILIMIALAILILVINLVVMYFAVKKHKNNGARSE